MRYEIERGPDVNNDLEAIYDFLFDTHLGFGERPDAAHERAAKRVARIEAAMERLGKIPKQGTLRANLMPGLRSVTKDRAIFYFTVDDDAHVVRVLAVFFGGQDHQREMLKRLLSE